ncbi:MAG: LptE family protein [Bernardetiaceae bacterium]
MFKQLIVLVFISLIVIACGGMKFTFQGGTIPPDAQTLSVQTFFDDVGAGPADLNVNITERLRDYFQRNTRLALVRQDGDLQFEGSITGYEVAPAASTAGENQQAALQRLTITVQVQYVNTFDEKNNFDKSFSFFSDFDAAQNLTDVEEALIEEIFEQIVLDIFNASVANW